MSGTSSIVRGFALYQQQDAIIRDYARRRCGGNTSLAVRTIISHFASCPEAENVDPLVGSESESSEQPEPSHD